MSALSQDELRKLKELLPLAYEEPEPQPSGSIIQPLRAGRWSAAIRMYSATEAGYYRDEGELLIRYVVNAVNAHDELSREVRELRGQNSILNRQVLDLSAGISSLSTPNVPVNSTLESLLLLLHKQNEKISKLLSDVLGESLSL